MSEQLIRLRLSAWMVQLLSAMLEKLSTQLGKRIILPEALLPADDEDLRDAWRQSLLEQLDADLSFLRKTLARLRTNGIADLNIASIEIFLRSTSAVRLSLKEVLLADLPESDLQTEGIYTETLPEEAQPAYACYVLLSNIQGQVIAQIEQYENAPSAPLSEYPEDFFHFSSAKGADAKSPTENDTPPDAAKAPDTNAAPDATSASDATNPPDTNAPDTPAHEASEDESEPEE